MTSNVNPMPPPSFHTQSPGHPSGSGNPYMNSGAQNGGNNGPFNNPPNFSPQPLLKGNNRQYSSPGPPSIY